MDHDRYDDAYILGILRSVKSVAMVGASANEVRPSFFVLKYLHLRGFGVRFLTIREEDSRSMDRVIKKIRSVLTQTANL